MISEALITFLAITRTTHLAVRITGARFFLPALSVKRFSTAGAIDEAVLSRQMDSCTSFSDDEWSAYWCRIAFSHIARLDSELKNAGIDSIRTWIEGDRNHSIPGGIEDFLRRGAESVTKTTLGHAVDLKTLGTEATAEVQSSLVAVDATLKAIVYFFLAAWPGKTPKRDAAYHMSARVFDILLDVVAPELNFEVERHLVSSGDETISIYALLPSALIRKTDQKIPAVLISNGLEGTNVETILSFLRSREQFTTALFFMEMPGTYNYDQPMEIHSAEQVYHDAISFLSHHHVVDACRIGMLGLSFGGYWSTRMAIKDKRLAAAASNGAPLARSFGPLASFGLPQIMIQALSNVVGATDPRSLGSKLHALTLTRLDIEQVHCPILAINGDKDTLIATKDTIDLAKWAPISELKLYSGDHCAMEHIQEWVTLSRLWFENRL